MAKGAIGDSLAGIARSVPNATLLYDVRTAVPKIDDPAAFLQNALQELPDTHLFIVFLNVWQGGGATRDEIWIPRNEETLKYTTKGLGKPHSSPIMVITAPYDDPLIQLSINQADKI